MTNRNDAKAHSELRNWNLRQQMSPTTSSTTIISQGDLTQTVSGSGSVVAARQVDLSFGQAGTITTIKVQIGDAIKSGQALAQIDATNLQLALQQAQANLKAAQANMAQAKI